MLIKRKIFNQLKEHLYRKEITIIIGPRQIGKTTIMELLKEHLEKEGKRTLFLSLDFEHDKIHFNSQLSLLRKIELEIGKKRGFIFIDEIQRKENAGIFLKGLYDMKLPYKFIVSGSGSMELKEKIYESLVGRKRVFELNPVSFKEFVNFKTSYKYENNLKEFFNIEKYKVEELFWEYLNFGGYPRVITEEIVEEKKLVMNDIFHSYLEKDISSLLLVKKTEEFSSLVKILASRIGKLINYSELSNTLGISFQTLKEYLWYLEKTFIFKKLTPYFRNIKKEITKSPVVYFYDLGLRNYLLNLFGNIYDENQIGFLFQNFIFNVLREKFKDKKIYFWRTKDGAEVDFVIDLGMELVPVEAKFKNYNSPVIEKSLKNFIKQYTPKKAFVINRNLKKKIKFQNSEIIFLTFFDLLFI